MGTQIISAVQAPGPAFFNAIEAPRKSSISVEGTPFLSGIAASVTRDLLNLSLALDFETAWRVKLGLSCVPSTRRFV